MGLRTLAAVAAANLLALSACGVGDVSDDETPSEPPSLADAEGWWQDTYGGVGCADSQTCSQSMLVETEQTEVDGDKVQFCFAYVTDYGHHESTRTHEGIAWTDRSGWIACHWLGHGGPDGIYGEPATDRRAVELGG